MDGAHGKLVTYNVVAYLGYYILAGIPSNRLSVTLGYCNIPSINVPTYQFTICSVPSPPSATCAMELLTMVLQRKHWYNGGPGRPNHEIGARSDN
ncbi:hypothetical protein CEXT_57541 [Caerostris extrusa]|uniref:Uncharacterized protein n=1 Tax=Caerostris extrusa TaxID=172846 RepID=A0AAV4NTT1_CAEEX|nr:hypothetical protein CEXT_57541 [Caerostris extrusa]